MARRSGRTREATRPEGHVDSESSEAETFSLWRKLKRAVTFVHYTNDEHFNFVLSWAVVVCAFCYVWENHITSTEYGKLGNNATIGIDPRIGWWLLELPVTISFVYFFFFKGGSQSQQPVPRLMAAIMCWHYAYRGWIFPSLIRVHSGSKNFALLTAIGGPVVTITHGYLNAKWFAEHGKHLNRKWLTNPIFIVGIITYVSGFSLLVWHDSIIRGLRDGPGPRYRIPHGGLFEYATCAQYLVELWTFLGFFLISYGPNGLFILLVSCVNLIPRAAVTTAWYKDKFGAEYPDRWHIFPGLY